MVRSYKTGGRESMPSLLEVALSIVIFLLLTATALTVLSAFSN